MTKPSADLSAKANGQEPITSYHWLVLTIASLGWVFDIFEGQIFVASMNEAMKSLLPAGTPQGTVAFYNDVSLGAFLWGGAVGGVMFGMLSDRIGRTTTMIVTIIMYSLFTCVTAAAQNWWQMAILRFLVAMGVGGEWAVASAMIAEVFPKRARAWSGTVFHASSVLGTYLAVAAGVFIVGNENIPEYWRWRIGFAVGALPALLIVVIRVGLREPDKWVAARKASRDDPRAKTGRLRELFAPAHLRATLVGVSLAAVGLATFWGIHIYGKDLTRRNTQRYYLEQADVSPGAPSILKEQVYAAHLGAIKRSEMLGMLLVTTGGGLGLLSFGPLCERIGRRGAFFLFHLGGLISSLVLFGLLSQASNPVLWGVLPIFGFLTLGMHAGYAIYFPELFPTRLRGTGAGFCFNAGRFLVPPLLLFIRWLQKGSGASEQALLDFRSVNIAVEVGAVTWGGFSLETASVLLSLLFVPGIIVLLFAPETKGRDLPE